MIQWTTEELGGGIVQVAHCAPQIPHKLAYAVKLATSRLSHGVGPQIVVTGTQCFP